MRMQRSYHGQSMKGTFRPGEMLTVEPVCLPQVRPGDVVVFRGRQGRDQTEIVHRVVRRVKGGLMTRGNEQDEIVHRVMRRISGGLVTRGDAVAQDDAWIVTDDHLIGRVCSKERNGRVSRVHGGRIGLCRGNALHVYWGLRRRAVRRMQGVYDRLKATGLARLVWKPRVTQLMISSPDGRYIQYVCDKRVVARFWPDTGVFECRKPWDLVIR